MSSCSSCRSWRRRRRSWRRSWLRRWMRRRGGFWSLREADARIQPTTLYEATTWAKTSRRHPSLISFLLSSSLSRAFSQDVHEPFPLLCFWKRKQRQQEKIRSRRHTLTESRRTCLHRPAELQFEREEDAASPVVRRARRARQRGDWRRSRRAVRPGEGLRRGQRRRETKLEHGGELVQTVRRAKLPRRGVLPRLLLLIR